MNYDHSEAEALAAGRLVIAERRMASEYPFHARFIATWEKRPDPVVGTMGVTVRSEALVLLFDPYFVLGCSYDELAAVLHHEINHVAFGHIFIDRSQFTDQRALLVAEEVTANEWVKGSLPGKPILLAQYPHLPLNEDVYARYSRLAGGRDKRVGAGQKRGSSGQKKFPPVPKKGRAGQNLPARERDSDSATEPLDNHEVWDEARSSGAVGQLIVSTLIREASEGLSEEDRQKLPPSLRKRLDKVRGGTAGQSLEEISSGRHAGFLNWQRLLSRYVRTAVEAVPAFYRPPRRFPSMVGIVPGRRHQPSRARVMAVIDTSGSISRGQLKGITSQLVALANFYDVTVVECDAVVQAVYRFGGSVSAVRGRGGTDLRPPFRPSLLSDIRPDVIVYFTDGYGEAPRAKPGVPVIWCITAAGRVPANWGREVRLPG